MRITADTNLLVRAIVADDPEQASVAIDLMAEAELVAIPLQALCELVWVLDRHYEVARQDILIAVTGLIGTGNVAVNRPAVEEGLQVMLAGGDFADGVIAHEGRWLGGEVFASFDRKAVKLLEHQGHAVHLLR